MAELTDAQREVRAVILEVLEGDVPLVELMDALMIQDAGAFQQVCRDHDVPASLLVEKIQRDQAAMGAGRSEDS